MRARYEVRQGGCSWYYSDFWAAFDKAELLNRHLPKFGLALVRRWNIVETPNRRKDDK